MNSRYIVLFISILLCSLPTTPILAQNDQEKQDNFKSDSKWNFLIEPYLMAPNMEGNVGVGKLPDVSVDASSSDIFSHLEMAAMLYGEAYSKDWAISSDVIYMKLGDDVVSERDIVEGSLEAKQFAWELSGFRTLLPWLDVGLGGRINSLTTEVEVTINTPQGNIFRDKKINETWVDPIIIARVKNPAGEKLLYQFRADIGGFGIGSDLAWQIQANVGYRFSKLFQLSGGYRIISMDYNKGDGEDRFLYDVNTSGPVLRLGFNL